MFQFGWGGFFSEFRSLKLTDRGTLSLLSERGNFGTWERSSASDCASDCASECASACASASSTQSQLDVRSPSMHSEQTQDAHPMLVQCRASVADGGPTPDQHQANVSSVIGYPDFQYKKHMEFHLL